MDDASEIKRLKTELALEKKRARNRVRQQKLRSSTHEHRLGFSISIEEARGILRHLQTSYRRGQTPDKWTTRFHGCLSRRIASYEAREKTSVRQPRFDEATKERARFLRREGYTLQEIAHETSAHKETVRHWLRARDREAAE